MKRRKQFNKTSDKYDFTTNTGRLKLLVDVVKAYEQLYPGRFRFYLNQFKKLKQVMSPKGYTDAKGRTVWSDNIPTEPFLFVQSVIPNFGSDPEFPGDMNLLKKAWEDFVCTPNRKHLRHTRLDTGGLNGPPQSQEEDSEEEALNDQGRPAKSYQLHRSKDPQVGTYTIVGDDHHEVRSEAPA